MRKNSGSNKTSIYIPDKAKWVYQAFRAAAESRGDSLSDAYIKAFELYILEVLSGVHVMHDAHLACADGRLDALISSEDRFSHYPETEGSVITVGIDPGSDASEIYSNLFSKMFNAMQKGEFHPIGEYDAKKEEE